MENTGYKIVNVRRLRLAWCLILVLAVPRVVCAQTTHLSLGKTQTSTSFRTSDWSEGLNHLLFTPKRGWAAEVGVEYALQPKSSVYSSLAVYRSGAKLEDYRVEGQDPYYLFELEDNEYTYNCWSLNTNYNMQVWQAGDVKVMAVAGLHIDRTMYRSDAEVDYKSVGPSDDPLDMLTRFGALRKTNIGCNLGARAVYKQDRWSYTLNYTYAPRLIKMGKFEKEIDNSNLLGINGISVREKVTFLTIGFGYTLNQITE